MNSLSCRYLGASESFPTIYPPIGGYIVGKLSEAPKYLHDNEFIEKGYRIGFNSWQKILKRYLINIIFFYAI